MPLYPVLQLQLFFALQHLLDIVRAACSARSVCVVLCFLMFLLALRNVFQYVLHSLSCHGISVFLPCRVCVECIEYFLLASRIILDNCKTGFLIMHGVLFSFCNVSYMLSNCVLISMDSMVVSYSFLKLCFHRYGICV